MPEFTRWQTALFTQARSDLHVFLVLLDQDRCHQLHYMQMAGEKVAKAFSAEVARDVPPSHTHYGLSRWVRTLSLSNRAVAELGYKSSADFQAALRSLRETADALENLSPKIANDRARGLVTGPYWNGIGTNAEYPWLDGVKVVAPAEFAFAEPSLSETKLIKLFNLLDYQVAHGLSVRRLR